MAELWQTAALIIAALVVVAGGMALGAIGVDWLKHGKP